MNIVATWTLAKANRQSLNVEGSFQHLLTDLYAFIATAIAGAVIILTGFERADAIASLLVAALMLRAAYGLLRASGRIFLEAAPAGLDPDEIGRLLVSQPDVREVHDLHVWEISSGFPALTAHVLVAADSDCHATRGQLALLLEEQFGIGAHDAAGRPRAGGRAAAHPDRRLGRRAQRRAPLRLDTTTQARERLGSAVPSRARPRARRAGSASAESAPASARPAATATAGPKPSEKACTEA